MKFACRGISTWLRVSAFFPSHSVAVQCGAVRVSNSHVCCRVRFHVFDVSARRPLQLVDSAGRRTGRTAQCAVVRRGRAAAAAVNRGGRWIDSRVVGHSCRCCCCLLSRECAQANELDTWNDGQQQRSTRAAAIRTPSARGRPMRALVRCCDTQTPVNTHA